MNAVEVKESQEEMDYSEAVPVEEELIECRLTVEAHA